MKKLVMAPLLLLFWLLKCSNCLLCKEACEYISEHFIAFLNKLGRDTLINIVNTSMSSNIIGAYADFFLAMVVHAAQTIEI